MRSPCCLSVYPFVSVRLCSPHNFKEAVRYLAVSLSVYPFVSVHVSVYVRVCPSV
jgi:hypothetical protein